MVKGIKRYKIYCAYKYTIKQSKLEKEIALAYYAVLVTENSIEKLEENKVTISKLLEETKEIYKGRFCR